jgi:hypothetical protein
MWATEEADEDEALLINTRCAEDVAAWASLRTVLHGGSFGPVASFPEHSPSAQPSAR